jgi:hypothetical protein
MTSNGSVKLLDFGIAKFLHAELLGQPADATATAVRAMTPEYASPEQVRGMKVTPASDVYALGVVLYELLSGHRPYRVKADTDELLRAICEEEPERPSLAIARTENIVTSEATSAHATPEGVSKERSRKLSQLRRSLSGDLDAIVLKALRKEASERYASVLALGEDVQRHLDGNTVLARKGRWSYHLKKLVERHRGAAAALLATILLSTAGGVVSLRRILLEKAVAQQERIAAQQRKNENILLRATHALRTDPTATIAWLKHYPLDAANWAAARDLSIAAVNGGVANHVLEGYVFLSPDRKVLATGGVASSVLWDIASGTIVKPLHLDALRIRFSPDSKRVLVNHLNSEVMELVNLESNEVRRFSGHIGETRGEDFSSDGQWIISVGVDKTMRLWSTSSDQHRILATLDTAPQWILFSPTRTRFAVGFLDGSVRLFDFTGKKFERLSRWSGYGDTPTVLP